MNTIQTSLLKRGLRPALCAALLLSCSPAAGEYSALAQKISEAAAGKGITRVLLGSFLPAGASVEGEARFASEKTASALASDNRLEVLDQSALEARAGSGQGWLQRLPAKLRPQALLKGSVFKEGDEVVVIARLVDAASGRVIASMEAKSAARFMELPPVPDINWSGAPSVAPVRDAFRDSPAEPSSDCGAAFKKFNAVNASVADLKARYWARKMKEPGFAYGSLSRNPGSEIRDPEAKRKFYELLSMYYDKEAVPAIDAGNLKKLEAFMAKEGGVIDRCGMN